MLHQGDEVGQPEGVLLEEDGLDIGMHRPLPFVRDLLNCDGYFALLVNPAAKWVGVPRARPVQTSAHSLSEQLTARLERKLSQDAVESLSRSAGPLRGALDALEQFAARRRDRTASRLSEVTAAIEDVARALERMRPPLDQVKQHLR